MIWFSLVVLIPLSAVVVRAWSGGWDAYWDVITNPQTWEAIKLTVVQSLLITLVNIVMGTLIAWVLVRDKFFGKRALEVLIDIPFALPTIVAGLVLLALYGPRSPLGIDVANTQKAVFLALAFVTLPFVVRTVQPVLEELDVEAEEAAASLGASPFTDLSQGGPPEPRPRDRRRCRIVIRPRHQRVRGDGVVVRKPGDAHRSGVGANPHVRRERQHGRGRSRGVDTLVDRTRRHRHR
jgi:hypothetical protein